MNQVKIGKLIAECRKAKKLTQVDLANMLGVTNKSVSKWETGNCLPDVSLYKQLCEILGITLNEFFAGEKIEEKNYKEVADENLFNALENSVFTLKDKIDYFDKKWEKDHLFGLIMEIVVIVFFIIYGLIKQNGFQYVFMAIGLIIGIVERNRKMAYIESHAYGKNSNISIEEIRSSINKLNQFKNDMQKFNSRQKAVDYLLKETNLSKKECENAYGFIINLDIEKIKK